MSDVVANTAGAWLMSRVRDRCLRKAFGLLARPGGLGEMLDRLDVSGEVRRDVTARLTQSVDMALATLLVEFDELRTAGGIAVRFRDGPAGEWVELGDAHPTHELYDYWIDRFAEFWESGRPKGEPRPGDAPAE